MDGLSNVRRIIRSDEMITRTPKEPTVIVLVKFEYLRTQNIKSRLMFLADALVERKQAASLHFQRSRSMWKTQGHNVTWQPS